MDDIVTRLREIADADVYRADISVSKLYEAVDEIERLRAELADWRRVAETEHIRLTNELKVVSDGL